MAEFEWTPQLVTRLLAEFERRPPLWDPTHELYRVSKAKYDSWAELARLFECDISDIRKKLNSVFASHRREKARVLRGERSNWFLYEHLRFLPHHVQNRPKVVAKKEVEVTYHEDSDQAEYLEEQDLDEDTYGSPAELVIKQEPKQVQKTTTFVSHQAKPRLTIKRPIKKRILKTASENSSISEMRILEALKTLKKNDGCKRKKDECDTFGEYIAESLRKHDDRTQSMIKQAINNILFEQEMKKYNSEQYVVIANVNEEDNPLMLGDQDSK